jgi:hypothetical protein
MALPAHLAKYSGLIDLLVDQLLEDAEQGVSSLDDPKTTKARPGKGRPSMSSSQSQAVPAHERYRRQRHVATRR